MSAYPSWTPAARPGIVPLQPLGFGTILGRSFVALRQNPRVLLGFALTVQVVSYLVVGGAIAAIGIASFSRLDRVDPASDDFGTVMAGSVATVGVSGIVLALAATALGVIVQGVVVAEVSRAVVAERRRLGELWRQVRPAAWRLVGYTFLATLAIVVVLGLLVATLIATGTLLLPAAIVLGILCVVGAIPLALWLTTKLLLVPAVLVLEGVSVRRAIARSWTLVRGRFWVALGVWILIQLVFGAIAQVVGIPFSLLSTLLGGIVAPTGEADATGFVAFFVGALLTQVVTLLVQAIGLVVQATGSTLVYVDCRMRREGLDLDLLSYVEQRDAGADDLPDPYRLHAGRAVPRPTTPGPYPVPGPYPAAYPYPPPAPAAYAPSGATPPAPGTHPQSRTYPRVGTYAPPASAPYPAPGMYPPPGAQPLPAGYPSPQPGRPASAAYPPAEPSAPVAYPPAAAGYAAQTAYPPHGAYPPPAIHPAPQRRDTDPASAAPAASSEPSASSEPLASAAPPADSAPPGAPVQPDPPAPPAAPARDHGGWVAPGQSADDGREST